MYGPVTVSSPARPSAGGTLERTTESDRTDRAHVRRDAKALECFTFSTLKVEEQRTESCVGCTEQEAVGNEGGIDDPVFDRPTLRGESAEGRRPLVRFAIALVVARRLIADDRDHGRRTEGRPGIGREPSGIRDRLPELCSCGEFAKDEEVDAVSTTGRGGSKCPFDDIGNEPLVKGSGIEPSAHLSGPQYVREFHGDTVAEWLVAKVDQTGSIYTIEVRTATASAGQAV